MGNLCGTPEENKGSAAPVTKLPGKVKETKPPGKMAVVKPPGEILTTRLS